MVTFGHGVEPVWSVVGSVGLWFLWLDEDDGSFSWDGTMIRLHDTEKWHNGTMQLYDEMAQRFDGTICHNGVYRGLWPGGDFWPFTNECERTMNK